MINKDELISWRSIVTGLVITVILAIITPYLDIRLISTFMGGCHLPPGALIALILLVLFINPIFKKVKFITGFSSKELLVIYSLILIGVMIPGHGSEKVFISVIQTPFYFATPENKFAELFQPYIPKWLIPYDENSIRYFFEGLPKGYKIPWSIWIKPLIFWTSFVILLYVLMFCLSVILRKQWIEKEKLSFPLASIPIEMVKDSDTQIFPSLFKNKIFWIGALIPIFIQTLNGLHLYFPLVPQIDLSLHLSQLFTEKPWSALKPIVTIVYPSVVAVSYILNKDVAFSLWFFYLYFKIQMMISNLTGFMPEASGIGMTKIMCATQTFGGFIIFVLMGLYLSKEHLRKAWQSIFRKNEYDRDEPVSYRIAFSGWLISSIGIIVMMKILGIPLLWGIIILFIYSIIIIALTKVIAEGGLLFIQHPFLLSEVGNNTIGLNSIGLSTLAPFIIIERSFITDLRGFLMPSIMHSFKIAESAKINTKRLTIGIILTVLISIAVSFYVTIYIFYKYGALNCHAWTGWVAGRSGFFVLSTIINKSSTTFLPQSNILNIISIIFGGISMWFIIYMRQRFLWWPFHPVGYIVAPTYALFMIWFSIFLGWFFKVIIMRYGGMKIYKLSLPFMFGVIIGEFFMFGTWAFVDFLCDKRWHCLLPD